MAAQLCACCSYETSQNQIIQSLTVICDSHNVISLYCFDGIETPLSSDSTIVQSDARLLSRWSAGRCSSQYRNSIGITCHAIANHFSIFVTYTNTEGAYCCVLSYHSDLLERLIHWPTIVPFLEKKSGASLTNVTALVILQSSCRVLFVLQEDSFMISAALSNIVDTIEACSYSTKFEGNCGIELSTSSLMKDPNYCAVSGTTTAVDCYKLPAFSTSNKSYKSLRSDDTVIQDFFAIEKQPQADIIILIKSKS